MIMIRTAHWKTKICFKTFGIRTKIMGGKLYHKRNEVENSDVEGFHRLRVNIRLKISCFLWSVQPYVRPIVELSKPQTNYFHLDVYRRTTASFWSQASRIFHRSCWHCCCLQPATNIFNFIFNFKEVTCSNSMTITWQKLGLVRNAPVKIRGKRPIRRSPSKMWSTYSILPLDQTLKTVTDWSNNDPVTTRPGVFVDPSLRPTNQLLWARRYHQLSTHQSLLNQKQKIWRLSDSEYSDSSESRRYSGLLSWCCNMRVRTLWPMHEHQPDQMNDHSQKNLLQSSEAALVPAECLLKCRKRE